MKALTVRQPWASLIICGAKDIENRSWRTTYQGKIAIHAGMQVDEDWMAKHQRLLRRHLGLTAPGRLPRGRVLGTVTVIDCVEHSRSRWTDCTLRWHWKLANAHAYAHRVPAKGKQRLWEWQRTPAAPWKSAL